MSTDKKTIDWYNRNAEAYTSHVQNPKDSKYHAYYEKPAIQKLLPPLEGKSVISLGCGPGEDAYFLKKSGASRVLGVDISHELIKIAKNRCPDCEFEVMDMEKLSFDSEFDVAYSSLALSYLKDWAMVMNRVFKLLKPGGVFLFSCEHPVVTAMELKVKEDSKVWSLTMERSKLKKLADIHGDYLGSHLSPSGIDAEVTTWHRSFSKLFKEVLGAGFVLKDFVEPEPLPEMEKISPATFQSLKKVPDFLIIKLLKPLN
jgi:trans-aconitate methyltransferase